jgi:predicted dehydrogenase
LIDSGVIGQVVQISASVGGDLLTSATHLVDAMRFLLGDAEGEWVIGQVDLRDPGFTNRQLGLQQWEQTHRRYGHHVEAGSLGLIQFAGGARGLLEVGILARPGAPAYGATVSGAEGSLEISADRPGEEPWLRARLRGEAAWVIPPITPNDAFQGEIEALLDILEHGGAHPLNMYAARKVHEILMAVYESARRRARIDLPFMGLTNPLEELLAAAQS